jgi:hypothetical protein
VCPKGVGVDRTREEDGGESVPREAGVSLAALSLPSGRGGDHVFGLRYGIAESL